MTSHSSQSPPSGAPPGPRVPGYTDDEPDSSILKISDRTVVAFCSAGDDMRAVTSTLNNSGYVLFPITEPLQLETLKYVPRFALIEPQRPAALELLRRLSQQIPAFYAVALLGNNEPEGPALNAGARLTLRRPVQVEDVLLVLNRFRRQHALETNASQIFARDRSHASTPLIEGVLAAIGHEIRNPLAAAMTNLEYLREADNPDQHALPAHDHQEVLKDTHSSLRRITGIMDVVSSLVKGEPPELQKVSLGRWVQNMVRSRSQQRCVEVRVDSHVKGWASPGLLEQVLNNLLDNALHAVRSSSKPRILVRVYAAGSEARISVRDNGPGVPRELRERIFEPFVTTKGKGGTGLGLVLGRHAVTRMGGTLTLGPSDQGAVFRIRLRRA